MLHVWRAALFATYLENLLCAHTHHQCKYVVDVMHVIGFSCKDIRCCALSHKLEVNSEDMVESRLLHPFPFDAKREALHIWPMKIHLVFCWRNLEAFGRSPWLRDGVLRAAAQHGGATAGILCRALMRMVIVAR